MSATELFERLKKKPTVGKQIVFPDGCAREVTKTNPLTTACLTPKSCHKAGTCDWANAEIRRNKK